MRQRGTTARLHGTLTEVRINVRESVYYRYFIDDTRIMWPPGAQNLYARSVDRPLSLTVAMIDLAPRQHREAPRRPTCHAPRFISGASRLESKTSYPFWNTAMNLSPS
ncbi:hypothetical protein ACGLWX_07125 [Halomonas sp. HMF6819]|uniref:hypothetical protein n=1 Tax=Halomonas sp. HMF6819 TaxID=3373085 RepID=UPI0037A2AFF6